MTTIREAVYLAHAPIDQLGIQPNDRICVSHDPAAGGTTVVASRSWVLPLNCLPELMRCLGHAELELFSTSTDATELDADASHNATVGA